MQTRANDGDPRGGGVVVRPRPPGARAGRLRAPPGAPLPPSPEHLRDADLPAPFGRFTLVGVLGSGGMGRVFRAVLTGPSGFRKDVALKVIHARHPDDRDAVRTELSAEARIGGLLKHPHVVDVYDFGEEDGQPYISMEVVFGLDLAALARRARLQPAHVLEIGAAIAAGLQHAHDLHVDGVRVGLVHRDLKPSNVLVSREGVVKVMDFGIAKIAGAAHHTETGVAKGTPAYMAPEQASAEPLDHRADLWSLGAILFELATGAPLLQGTTIIELMMQLLKLPDRLARPDALSDIDRAVPGLAVVVQRCLRRDPAERWDSAASIEEALRALLAEAPAAPSLRSLVRDVLAGGDGAELPAMKTRAHAAGLALSATIERGTPTNITPDGQSFVGREADLDALRERLARHRLVTLLGPGGTGKTRLAREFARRSLDTVPQGGAWFVALDVARSLEGVLHAVGLALDLPITESDPAAQVERIGRALAGRGRVLILLDNVEQVVEHAAATVGRWLDLAPLARFIVTSREPLRLPGEERLPLGPLLEDAAVELFVDRARLARPGFTLADDERPIVLHIVNRLDRLPLAVELAAARVTVLPPAKLRDRLDQRFRLLRGTGRDVTARQATLEGAIAWSWDLLDPAERHTLALCSVFCAGFSVEQAESLIDLSVFPGAPWVLDVVEALRDKSLLRSLAAERGEPRFGMYESIRAFADARLDELGVRSEAEAAHVRVTLERAAGIEARLHGPQGADAQLDLALLVEDLVAVLRRADPGSPETAVRAALFAEPHLRRRGPAALYRRILDRAGELAVTVPGALRAELLGARSQLLRVQGNNAEAMELGWQGVRLAEELGDRVLAATLCITLGYSLRSPEGLDEVEAAQRAALPVLEAAGRWIDAGRLLSSLAVAVGYGGRVKEEYSLHLQALALHKKVGNRRMQAAESGNIAVLYALDGESREAEHWLHEALAGFRAVHDRTAELISLGNLGSLYIEMQRPDEAERAIRRALEGVREMGLGSFEPVLSCNLGLLKLNLGELDAAETLFLQGQALYAAGSPSLYHLAMLDAYRGLGRALAGDPRQARRLLELGTAQYREARMQRDLGQLLGLVAAARATDGDEAEAVAALDEARGIAEELDDDDVRSHVLLGEGHVELLRARLARAAGEEEDAFLFASLAEARLSMVDLVRPRPSLLRLGHRWLARACGITPP